MAENKTSFNDFLAYQRVDGYTDGFVEEIEEHIDRLDPQKDSIEIIYLREVIEDVDDCDRIWTEEDLKTYVLEDFIERNNADGIRGYLNTESIIKDEMSEYTTINIDGNDYYILR